MFNFNTINYSLELGVCSIYTCKFAYFRKEGRVSYIVQAPIKYGLGTNLDHLFMTERESVCASISQKGAERGSKAGCVLTAPTWYSNSQTGRS